MIHELLLYAHVVGACVLLGTGAGIAFFMVISNRSGSPALVAHVSGIVVLADMVFTATAAIAQPVTGLLLAAHLGFDLGESWIVAALALYVVVGAFWLPVVVIQMRLRRLAETARDRGTPLCDTYRRLYRVWFACGFPAFLAVLAILWLMIAKPTLW